MGPLPIYRKPPISTYFTIWFESNFFPPPLKFSSVCSNCRVVTEWFHHSTERNVRSVGLEVKWNCNQPVKVDSEWNNDRYPLIRSDIFWGRIQFQVLQHIDIAYCALVQYNCTYNLCVWKYCCTLFIPTNRELHSSRPDSLVQKI